MILIREFYSSPSITCPLNIESHRILLKATFRKLPNLQHYKSVCPQKGEKAETTGSCETEELPEANRSNDGDEDDLLQTFFPSYSKSETEDDSISEVVENAVTPPDETPTVKKAHATGT